MHGRARPAVIWPTFPSATRRGRPRAPPQGASAIMLGPLPRRNELLESPAVSASCALRSAMSQSASPSTTNRRARLARAEAPSSERHRPVSEVMDEGPPPIDPMFRSTEMVRATRRASRGPESSSPPGRRSRWRRRRGHLDDHCHLAAIVSADAQGSCHHTTSIAHRGPGARASRASAVMSVACSASARAT